MTPGCVVAPDDKECLWQLPALYSHSLPRCADEGKIKEMMFVTLQEYKAGLWFMLMSAKIVLCLNN